MKPLKIKHFIYLTFLGIIFLVNGCGTTKSPLIEIGNQELAQFLEHSSSVFIYIGRPTCPVCEEFEPILIEVLNEINKKVYYFNTDNARKEDEEKMMALLQSLGVVSVPSIIHLEDAVIIEKLSGLQSANDLRLFLKNY